MTLKLVNSDNAPAAVGPYSQALMTDDLVFTSGQLPIDPATGEFPDNTIESQARASLNNLKTVLEEAGSSMDKVLKTVVYLDDLGDFAKLNEIYAEYFNDPYPARSCYEVAALPKGAKVEIEAVAVI